MADLINPESSKILAACIPELRGILGVSIGTEAIDLGLTSSESLTRIKTILTMMFQTFVSKTKAPPLDIRLM